MIAEQSIRTKGSGIWTNNFRRVQLMLGWWGLLLIIGGYLHNTNARAWGSTAILLVWLGLAIAGLVGSYLFAPLIFASGMLILWGSAIIISLAVTWLIIFPLSSGGSDSIPTIWHTALAITYFLNGYYMDKRLYWLAGWEGLVALFMLGIGLKFFSVDIITSNKGLVFGLTSGIPLLIAALPFWKERF